MNAADDDAAETAWTRERKKELADIGVQLSQKDQQCLEAQNAQETLRQLLAERRQSIDKVKAWLEDREQEVEQYEREVKHGDAAIDSAEAGRETLSLAKQAKVQKTEDRMEVKLQKVLDKVRGRYLGQVRTTHKDEMGPGVL